MHICPAFKNLAQTILFAVSFMSQSLKIKVGLLPPSSKVTGVKFSAAAL